MNGIYFGKSVEIRSYSANIKSSQTSILKIELACSDPGDLGYLIDSLDRILLDQKASRAKPPRKPQLLLTDQRGGDA
jgi:hypothetical protein